MAVDVGALGFVGTPVEQARARVFLENVGDAAEPAVVLHALPASAHMTPALFAAEVRKMPPMQRVPAMHLKHRFRLELERVLGALGIAGLARVAGKSGYTL